jgi:1-acyl-sn-glycerol-3-phosphate acyltransferase
MTMAAVLALFCALFIFIRAEIMLRLVALFRPDALLDHVNMTQPVISRGLFASPRMIAGFRLDIERWRGPPLPRVFLLVSNHQSLIDIPALMAAFPRHALRFVAKKELGRGLPYVSVALRRGYHALISRTSDFREGHRELVRFADLTKRGICPAVFPEGTRSKTGFVKAFQAGAVRIILERARLPVLSVAVDGGWRISKIPRLLTRLRGTRYRVKPLTLYAAPKGKREILDLLGTIEKELAAQVRAWRTSGP